MCHDNDRCFCLPYALSMTTTKNAYTYLHVWMCVRAYMRVCECMGVCACVHTCADQCCSVVVRLEWRFPWLWEDSPWSRQKYSSCFCVQRPLIRTQKPTGRQHFPLFCFQHRSIQEIGWPATQGHRLMDPHAEISCQNDFVIPNNFQTPQCTDRGHVEDTQNGAVVHKSWQIAFCVFSKLHNSMQPLLFVVEIHRPVDEATSALSITSREVPWLWAQINNIFGHPQFAQFSRTLQIVVNFSRLGWPAVVWKWQVHRSHSVFHRLVMKPRVKDRAGSQGLQIGEVAFLSQKSQRKSWSHSGAYHHHVKISKLFLAKEPSQQNKKGN